MVKEFIRAFCLVFLAEIGDKSLIIAMYFSIQYMIKDVFFGITLGVVANHGLAIILGRLISKSFPLEGIQYIAGIVFLAFGFLSLQDSGFDEFEKSKNINPIITVALTYFIGELGDKTQITAMTLAIESNYVLLVLLGTSLGMLTTSALGIFIGSRVGDRIPELAIKIVSSILFLVIGSAKTIRYLPSLYLSQTNRTMFMLLIIFIEMILIRRYIKKHKKGRKEYNLKNVTRDMHKQADTLRRLFGKICLGEENCGSCSGQNCLIGYGRFILDEARLGDNYYQNDYIDIKRLQKKEYDKDRIIEALIVILLDYELNGWVSEPDYLANKIKMVLENLLFDHFTIEGNSLKEYMENVKSIDEKTCMNINNMVISMKEKVLI